MCASEDLRNGADKIPRSMSWVSNMRVYELDIFGHSGYLIEGESRNFWRQNPCIAEQAKGFFSPCGENIDYFIWPIEKTGIIEKFIACWDIYRWGRKFPSKNVWGN